MAPVKKALVFTMEGNADGEAALAFFQARGVAVDVRDVGRDPQASLDLFARAGRLGRLGWPRCGTGWSTRPCAVLS